MKKNFKARGRDISGWLIFDKPHAMGSTEAVSYIKKLFKAQKVGHAGTLDPLASGMLPIALGSATKTVSYVMDGEKSYIFKVTWGQERSTDDLEGEITESSTNRPTRESIEELLPKYTGKLLQHPPLYSALKINGVRAYDLIRNGNTPALQPRTVEISSFEIIEHTENMTSFMVKCGKGTYIRSLARDLGRELNCFGHISYLRRLSVLPFTESTMISKEQLDALSSETATDDLETLDNLLISPLMALTNLPQSNICKQEVIDISHGRPILLRNNITDFDAFCVKYNDDIIALGCVTHGVFYPKKVFNAYIE
ncbi:tRNA pseudouridine(55) synthase TruB [Bartonella sp. DGB1]|uniref:tRNA pseudouridine(55) synthase TruB n=1 Tax=Bartonella sp. DGB1 TaxID=3239807 RepID=UPI003526BED1